MRRNEALQETNISQSNRMYLDIVKGVAIFLMLWGHCIQCCANNSFDFFENEVFKIIYSFHMPLFMLVSGYLFYFSCKKRNLRELLIHRAQAMLQPIVICGIFVYFITVAIEKHNIEAISDGRWMSSLGSLWFLWSVLCASIVIAVCEKITSIKILRLLIIILGAGFVWLFPNNDMNLFMYPFFVGGFYFAKYKDKIPMALMNVKYFSLVLFPLMMLFYQKKHFIYTTGILSSANKLELLSIDLFRWAIGFIGSVFVLVILEVIYNNLICKELIIAKPVAQLGKNHFRFIASQYLCFHFGFQKCIQSFVIR